MIENGFCVLSGIYCPRMHDVIAPRVFESSQIAQKGEIEFLSILLFYAWGKSIYFFINTLMHLVKYFLPLRIFNEHIFLLAEFLALRNLENAEMSTECPKAPLNGAHKVKYGSRTAVNCNAVASLPHVRYSTLEYQTYFWPKKNITVYKLRVFYRHLNKYHLPKLNHECILSITKISA